MCHLYFSSTEHKYERLAVFIISGTFEVLSHFAIQLIIIDAFLILRLILNYVEIVIPIFIEHFEWKNLV